MNKLLFESKKTKTICALITVIILTGIIGMASKAQTERRASNIKSKGIFDYDNGTVVVDASDLTYLADEIDLLEETYKKKTVKALNKLSTYFMMDNSTTHDPDESNLDPDSSVILPFGSIIDGILASQSIPTEKTYTGTLPGEENETTGNISAATAENLSLGTAAWVDGELVIGTGADNNSYYSQGHTEGVNSSKGNPRLYCPATNGTSADTANFPAGTYTLSGIYKGYGLHEASINLTNLTTGEVIYHVTSDPDGNENVILAVSKSFTLSSNAKVRLTTSGSTNYSMSFATAGVK